MNIKKNIEHIKSILKDDLCFDEVSEFLDTIDEQADEHEGEIDDLENNIEELEERIKELERTEAGEAHYVGLDTIYIRLESGNIEVRQRLDVFLERLKKHNGASIV